MTLTKEQFAELYNKGITLDQINAFESGKTPEQIKSENAPQSSSFLGNLIKDPLKTLLIQPAARTAEAIGRTGILGQDIKTGYEQMQNEPQQYLGVTVEPQKAFGEGGAKQILGDIAKSTSYLYTGGAGAQAVKTGLKGEIIQGALQGAKTGAIGGGTASFGEAIQNAENQPSDVAYKTLFGTVTGGITGGILGATTPIVVKTAGKIKEYTNINKLEEKLYTANRDILKPTSSQLEDWKQIKVDPIKTFVKEFGPEGIPTSGDKLQLDNLIEQVDTKYKAGSEGFNTILRNSPETTSLAEAERQAIERINKSSLIPSAKKTAIARIQNEIPLLRQEAQSAGVLLEGDRIPVSYTDNLKDRFWGATKNFGPEEAGIANETNRAMGRTFASQIENSVQDLNVKNYNKKLQELITLKDFLESRNGKVPGSGGKMARYTARIIGGIGGSGSGPVGSVVGSITADKLAQAIINPNSQTWIIRKQLEKLSPEVRQSLQQEAEQIIANMAQKRATTLRLPPGNPSQIPIPMYPPFDKGQIPQQIFNQDMLNIQTKNVLPERASPMITPK